MTRSELLSLLVAHARSNGFEFRRWYTRRLELPWINADAAIHLLDAQRRYYALLFSHEFAHAFWAPGSDILIELPTQSFPSVMSDGTVRTVERKQHRRRSARPDAWRYHLQQMAAAEDPLRYIRRFLRVEDALDPDPATGRPPRAGTPVKALGKAPAKVPAGPTAKARRPRSEPAVAPAFLSRPYNGKLPSAVPKVMLPLRRAKP